MPRVSHVACTYNYIINYIIINWLCLQPFRLSAFGAVLICPVWRAFVAARMQQDDFLPGWVPSRVICAQHKLKRKAAEESEKTAVAAKEASEAQERKAKEAAESAAVPAAVAAAADETLVRADADDDGYVTETSVLSNDDTPTDLEARPIPPNQNAFTEEHQASVGSETMVPPPARALTDTEEYVSV